jgi:tyrosinase
MVRIRNLLFYTIVMLWFVESINAQSIRKDHREMTPSEKTVYRNAVVARKDFHMEEAAHHAKHFNFEIHTRNLPNGQRVNGTQFLSWHRLFLLEVEDRLKTSGGTNAFRISLPYWNWADENSNVTWDNSGFLDIPTLQNAGFLCDNDSDGQRTDGLPITPRVLITRNIAASFNITNSNINDMINGSGVTSFMPSFFQAVSQSSDFFSKRLEHWHNLGHNFVGGSMLSIESPADPVFYLHHNFVDKLWEDWEGKEDNIKSSFPTPANEINDWPNTNPNSTTDSRHLVVNLNRDNASFDRSFEVRYAFEKKLLLDGLNGNFNTSSTDGNTKTYCYVAWNGSYVEGTIYAGDVQRNSSDDIIADNKGGFVVDDAADFSAGSAIELLPGFDVLYGANFSAQIVDRPCGYSSNFGVRANDDGVDVESLKARNSTTSSTTMGKVYPNPFGDELNVAYEVGEDTPLSIQLVNALGQTVWQQNFGTQSKGAFQTTIPTNDLVKGLYTVLIKTNAGQKVFKAVH